jgi:VanZ family protein
MTKRTPRQTKEKENSSAHQRFWRYGPLLLWMVLMSVASTSEFSAFNTSTVVRPLILWFFPNLDETQVASIHFLIRKVAHFTEYAVLAFLAMRTFATSSNAFIQRHWFQLGLFLVVIYSLLDEFHQSFVPSRTASIYDCAIDVSGGLTVLIIFKLCVKRAQKAEARSH